MELKELVLSNSENEAQCNGLIFRARETIYEQPSNNSFVYKIEMIPAKKKSCSGCINCDWQRDVVQEAISNNTLLFTDAIENNEYYTIRITNICKDWETGIVDDYDVEFIKIKE